MRNYNVYLPRGTKIFKTRPGDCRKKGVRAKTRETRGQSKNLGEVFTLNRENRQVFTLTPNIRQTSIHLYSRPPSSSTILAL